KRIDQRQVARQPISHASVRHTVGTSAATAARVIQGWFEKSAIKGSSPTQVIWPLEGATSRTSTTSPAWNLRVSRSLVRIHTTPRRIVMNRALDAEWNTS